MAHSFTNLKYHVVFSTKYRLKWITADFETALYGYIGGVIRKKGGQLIEIGGIEDHLHILAGFPRSRSVAGMVGAIKSNSSSFGKEKSGNPAFSWQLGYAAFTVSESQVPRVKAYIRRQKEHHRSVSYEQEVRELCRRHGIRLEGSFSRPARCPRARRAACDSPGCQPGVAARRAEARCRGFETGSVSQTGSVSESP